MKVFFQEQRISKEKRIFRNGEILVKGGGGEGGLLRGPKIQSYREISSTIVVSGGGARIDIQTASPGESLERDVVVQLNRKLCSRYKANRNFPPVYSAF